MLYIETFICWLLLPGEWNCHPSVQILLLEKCSLCTLKTTWFVPRTLGLCLSFSYCLWFPGDHIAGMLAVSVASSRTLEVLDLEGTGLTNQSAQVYSKLRTTSGNMGIFLYIYSNKLLYIYTHTHTCWFLWFTGTFHRRNGFYTVQAVCAIALHLPYT